MGIKIIKQKHFKYQTGGTTVKPYNWKPIPKQEGVLIPYRPKDDIDFSGIVTTRNRAYDPEAMDYINKKLQYLPDIQRSVILGTIIEESGGNPFAKSKNGTYQGLLQWSANRYRIPDDVKDKYGEIDRQLEYLGSTLNNLTDAVSWTHGGSGSKYQTAKDAHANFNSDDLWKAHRAFSYGYVRPLGKEQSAKNRYKVVQQVHDKAKYQPGGVIDDNEGYKPTAKEHEANINFFKDFSDRYTKMNGVDKSEEILGTLEKERPIVNPKGKGNYYNPKKDEINLIGYDENHFTHEFVHKLNDSEPIPRLERSQEEVDLLHAAYPLGKLQNSSRAYRKYAGNTEHFTTNTSLRRNISDANGGVTGEELDKIIREMPSEKLGVEASSTGYASPRDYFNFDSSVNSPQSYYEKMGNETPWKDLKRKEQKEWKWHYNNKIGVEKIGVPNEELINKLREALIKVAGVNDTNYDNYV